jgi:hypothetical protein
MPEPVSGAIYKEKFYAMFQEFKAIIYFLRLERELFLFFILPVVVLSGCHSVKSRAASPANLFESGEIRLAAVAVKEKFGGGTSAARVLEVQITETEFGVKVRDAENPQNVDFYKYEKGALIKVAPVELDPIERSFAFTLFEFDDVDFSVVPRLAEEIRKSARLEDGKITGIQIRRRLNIPADSENFSEIQWTIKFSDGRKTVTAKADERGKLLFVDLSNPAQSAEFVDAAPRRSVPFAEGGNLSQEGREQ